MVVDEEVRRGEVAKCVVVFTVVGENEVVGKVKQATKRRQKERNTFFLLLVFLYLWRGAALFVCILEVVSLIVVEVFL